MKIWGVITTILMVIFLGASVWLYSQNQRLSSENQKLGADKKDLESKVTSLTSAKEIAEKNFNSLKDRLAKKAEVLVIFVRDANNADKMNRAKNLINEINEPTLINDWKVAEDPNTGEESAVKLMEDLSISIAKEVGLNL